MNAIILIFSFLFIVTYDSTARIKNGYAQQIQTTRSALRALKLQLAAGNDLSVSERRRLKAEIQNLVTYISCYELTEELIARLKTISPGIFWNVENIRDKKGRPTDVYVKLVPDDRTRVNLKGASFVSQVVGDADASCSEYGNFTASIEVCIRDNSLFLLSHEFGHMNYIIPNLAAYKQYYSKQYGIGRKYNLPYIGHAHQDKSGRMANLFEKIYRDDMLNYKGTIGARLQDIVGLYSRLKKMHGAVEARYDYAIAHVF